MDNVFNIPTTWTNQQLFSTTDEYREIMEKQNEIISVLNKLATRPYSVTNVTSISEMKKAERVN